MKVLIKHVIALEPKWLDTLVSEIVTASKTIYPSDVEEMAAIKAMIEPEMNIAAKEAFNAGMNVGLMGGDMADTAMYAAKPIM